MKVYFTVACLALTSTAAHAQAREQMGSALQLTLGPASVWSGTYERRVAVAASAMWSSPIGDRYRWGLAYSVQSDLDNADSCTVRPSLGSGCLPNMPLVVSWSALVGRAWQHGSLATGWSFRTSVGPSLVKVYLREQPRNRFINLGGPTGRIDLVKRAGAHFSLAASVSATMVPAIPRNARGIVTSGIGIELHRQTPP